MLAIGPVASANKWKTIMIKKFLILSLALCLSAGSALAYNPRPIPFITLESPEANIHIKTSKVARLYGPVMQESYTRFKKDMELTASVPGDRVILINSPGGEVDLGNKMLDIMKQEQKAGVRVVCFAFNDAHSMAFNFLTQCDVRLMAPGTMSLVHKVARLAIAERLTAKNLRIIADDLDKSDEPFRQANAAAMHLTLVEYDLYADKETYFRAETLLKMKYLHGIGLIQK